MNEIEEIKENFLKKIKCFYENLVKEGCRDAQTNLPYNYFRERGEWQSHLNATFQSVSDILNDCPDLNYNNLIDYAIDDVEMIVNDENLS